MNKKGFTLVELLGVIIILFFIAMLIFPSVRDIVNSSKDTTKQKQINDILSATYDFSLKNINRLPKNTGDKTYVTLSELKLNSLISSNIIDPSTNQPYSDDLVISISNVGPNYKTNNIYSKTNGNYLYTLEAELMSSSDYNANKPMIILNGLTADSNGDYVSTVNVNTDFTKSSYIATSYKGEDLTDSVVTNILFKDKLVETIDISKMGIYYINYTVVDNEGYSNTVRQNVIITDNLEPTLNIPESTTIGLDVNDYDLMENVTCTDNSGKCDITYTGDIEYGVADKYIIEYTAKDPSGNTTKEKRVITIE